MIISRYTLGFVLLTALIGCEDSDPARPPAHLDRQSALGALQWCLFYEAQVRYLPTLSLDALAGREPDERAGPPRLKSVDQLREELDAHPVTTRDCVLCQTLASCASALTRDDLAHRYQAQHLAQEALLLAGYPMGEELPTELRSQIPPAGGPTLARLLATACQGCIAGRQVAQEPQATTVRNACDRLLAARRDALDRLMRQESGCQDEGQKPRVVNGIEIVRLPCSALSGGSDLSRLDACQRLEACAMVFVQARWPDGRSTLSPGIWSVSRLAQTIESLCPDALDQAAESVKQWEVGRFHPATEITPEQCGQGSPRLGPALRRACTEQWSTR